MPYLHSIPSSKEPKVDGLLLRNVCIDERASIAVPGNNKHSFYHSFFPHLKKIRACVSFSCAIYINSVLLCNSFSFPFFFACGRKSVLKVELLKDQNLKSHLLPLIIPYRSSGEKLIKYQANSSQ